MSSSSNVATYTMQLIPSSERDQTTTDIVQQIDADLQDIPGAETTVSAMDGGMGFGDPITIELNGPEHEVLRELSELVVTEISKVDGIYNPESSSSGGVPQMSIVVEDRKSTRLNSSHVAISYAVFCLTKT